MNSQKGFIQIPILIVMIVTAVVGGSAFVAYEATKSSENNYSQEIILNEQTKQVTTTENIATTTEDKERVETKKNMEQKEEEKDTLISSLQKQIDSLIEQVNNLTQQESEQKEESSTESNTVNLPNGAIVEMDASGNIVRYIKQPTSQPIETTNSQNLNVPQTLNDIRIESVLVSPDETSVKIKWQTNKSAESKVFISGGNLSSKMFLSESGLTTNHVANIGTLSPTTNYSYEITAVNESGFVRKTGIFKTLDAFAPTFTIDKEVIENNGVDFATIRIETKLTNGSILPNKPLKIIVSGVETILYSDEQGILIYKTPTDNSPSQIFTCGNNPTINISVRDPDNDAVVFAKSIKVINVKTPVKWGGVCP